MVMGTAAGVPDGTVLNVKRLMPRELDEAAEASAYYEREKRDQTDAAGADAAEDPALADIAAAAREAAEMDVRMVTYASCGLAVKAYLVVPERPVHGGPANEWPGIVYCRGGIKRVGMVHLPRMVALARRGYAVMAPLYRGNMGGEGREDFAGEDRYDAVNAVRALASMPGILARPIPLIGFSRGSVMALAAAAEDESAVGPVAVLGGVTDMFLTYEERVDLRRMLRRVVGHPKKDPAAYEYRSPVRWAERINRPVLIVHGTADPLVGVKHARLLAEKLAALGKPHSLRLLEGQGHRLARKEEEEMLDCIVTWFAGHGAPPRPGLAESGVEDHDHERP